MSIVAIVLPLALIIVGAAVGAFIWAARSGQFDDTETPASRVLIDDAAARPGPAAPRE
jgi:cbb3-type cytochrome oxidase maturation protein